jgi:sugar-specific transcriptional regulator TrmB
MESIELTKLGLTEGEAKVYLALLKLGSSTVGPIVKKSKVAYSNIYEVLERLISKGLVSFIKKEKTKYFQAHRQTD